MSKSMTYGAVALAGLVVGVALAGFAGVSLMPSMMLQVHESALDFDGTVAKLQENMKAEGWSSPGLIDINKSMSKHGVEFAPRVKVVQLCKAEYAREVLTTNREVSAMMPCAISVYEDDLGKVWIAKINTGLMGKMFGGVIAEVMGGKVAAEEGAILEGVVKH